MITHAVTRQGSTAAAVHAAHHPAWAIATLIVGVVAALAIASTVAVLLAIGLAACHAAIETPAARRVRAERAARAQRRTRHAQRERRIEAAGADADELRQLAEVVDHVADRGAPAAFDVEPLLDHYVELTAARQRCFAALARANPPCLEAKLVLARAASPRSAEVLERRLSRARSLAETAQRLDEDIAELTETIRYCGERAELFDESMPALDPDLVASALACYDAYDTCDAVGAR
jgi:hypothetical protein